MVKKIPNAENLSTDGADRQVFHYYDETGKPVYKTKEVFKGVKKIVLFPYSVRKALGQINPKKIKEIELIGWDSIDDVPKHFRKTAPYGFSTIPMKQLMSSMYTKFRDVEKLIVGINIPTRFTKKQISLNYSDFESLIKVMTSERTLYDKNRKSSITNELARLTTKVTKAERPVTGGEVESFLNRFDSYDKLNSKDVEAISKLFDKIPKTKLSVTTTTHFIKTKEKIDVIYLEEILAEFDKLLRNTGADEEAWQKFFDKNTWVLNHLFAYEVILKKGKAYVGGKTMENADGRIVDFLFESGFRDNMALLEIKTPDAPLLKTKAYREPSVFALSDELSGGINQCLDQKDNSIKEFGKVERLFNPKTVLIIGRKDKLTDHQAECFELYRTNLKDVDIVTFDELHSKLKVLIQVITGNKPKKSK